MIKNMEKRNFPSKHNFSTLQSFFFSFFPSFFLSLLAQLQRSILPLSSRNFHRQFERHKLRQAKTVELNFSANSETSFEVSFPIPRSTSTLGSFAWSGTTRFHPIWKMLFDHRIRTSSRTINTLSPSLSFSLSLSLHSNGGVWRKRKTRGWSGRKRALGWMEFEVFSCHPETTTRPIEPFIYSAAFEERGKSLERDVKWTIFGTDRSLPTILTTLIARHIDNHSPLNVQIFLPYFSLPSLISIDLFPNINFRAQFSWFLEEFFSFSFFIFIQNGFEYVVE